MRITLAVYGLILLLSSAYGSFNLYINEHETMRLLGELSRPQKLLFKQKFYDQKLQKSLRQFPCVKSNRAVVNLTRLIISTNTCCRFLNRRSIKSLCVAAQLLSHSIGGLHLLPGYRSAYFLLISKQNRKNTSTKSLPHKIIFFHNNSEIKCGEKSFEYCSYDR